MNNSRRILQMNQDNSWLFSSLSQYIMLTYCYQSCEISSHQSEKVISINSADSYENKIPEYACILMPLEYEGKTDSFFFLQYRIDSSFRSSITNKYTLIPTLLLSLSCTSFFNIQVRWKWWYTPNDNGNKRESTDIWFLCFTACWVGWRIVCLPKRSYYKYVLSDDSFWSKKFF